MKITDIETFVVDTGFTPRRPWLFSAIRTDVGLRGTEDRSPRLALAARPLRHPAPAPAASDDTPFGAIIGALVGVFAGVSLWALIAFAILLLR